jgi:hypothetical protein
MVRAYCLVYLMIEALTVYEAAQRTKTVTAECTGALSLGSTYLQPNDLSPRLSQRSPRLFSFGYVTF